MRSKRNLGKSINLELVWLFNKYWFTMNDVFHRASEPTGWKWTDWWNPFSLLYLLIQVIHKQIMNYRKFLCKSCFDNILSPIPCSNRILIFLGTHPLSLSIYNIQITLISSPILVEGQPVTVLKWSQHPISSYSEWIQEVYIILEPIWLIVRLFSRTTKIKTLC